MTAWMTARVPPSVEHTAIQYGVPQITYLSGAVLAHDPACPDVTIVPPRFVLAPRLGRQPATSRGNPFAGRRTNAIAALRGLHVDPNPTPLDRPFISRMLMRVLPVDFAAVSLLDASGCLRRTQPATRSGFPRAREPLTLAPVNDLAEPADESLMLAYAAGDATAFEQLYARHRGPLYRFLLRQLRDPALADEFFQDVWQRVIAARRGWKPEAAFTTWLFRIAHNRLNDHWRALKHRPPAPDDAEDRTARVQDPDTPERQLSEFEQRRRLQLAMAELPEDQREVLHLRLEQELTLEEIGEITGVGRETVKSRLRYAMDKLRARLSE